MSVPQVLYNGSLDFKIMPIIDCYVCDDGKRYLHYNQVLHYTQVSNLLDIYLIKKYIKHTGYYFLAVEAGDLIDVLIQKTKDLEDKYQKDLLYESRCLFVLKICIESGLGLIPLIDLVCDYTPDKRGKDEYQKIFQENYDRLTKRS